MPRGRQSRRRRSGRAIQDFHPGTKGSPTPPYGGVGRRNWNYLSPAGGHMSTSNEHRDQRTNNSRNPAPLGFRHWYAEANDQSDYRAGEIPEATNGNRRFFMYCGSSRCLCRSWRR